MREEKIVCPSGLTGVISAMRAPELNALADVKGMRSGETFERILSGCWLKTTEPGRAYPESKSMPRVAWSSALSADRFYALLRIRALSFGEIYKFRMQCPGCGAWENCSVDLSKLETHPVPDLSCTSYREGRNEFPAWVPDPEGEPPPDGFEPAAKLREQWEAASEVQRAVQGLFDPSRGWAVAFRLIDGATEVRGAKDSRKNPDKRVTIAVKWRISKLLHEDLANYPGHVEKWLEQLSTQTIADLLAVAEGLDGGIDTRFDDFECSACEWTPEEEDDFELPFGRDFWTPPKRMKKGSRGKRRKR